MNEWDDPLPGYGLAIGMTEYVVERETANGVWLRPEFGGDLLWVSTTARKRKAYPTKEQAIASFIARKQVQRDILTKQLRDVDGYLRLLSREYGVEVPVPKEAFYGV